TLTGRLVLAHEITHALQDQNFELLELGVEDHENGDRQLALMAIIEGDATLLMSEYMIEHASPFGLLSELPSLLTMSQEELDRAPVAIRESLMFPYLRGVQFFMDLAGRVPADDDDAEPFAVALQPGWRSRVFLNPPISTEQIMHPEKYLRGEAPEPIDPF